MTYYEGAMALAVAMLLESQASTLRLVAALAMNEAEGLAEPEHVKALQEYCDQMIEVAAVIREACDD